ncbi:MAG: DUF2500 domain-containing protein [Defluviitaleaceae bacterium]|nr:DUF2500 domain-containing protein [Defluviitaleaceae bacterium]
MELLFILAFILVWLGFALLRKEEDAEKIFAKIVRKGGLMGIVNLDTHWLVEFEEIETGKRLEVQVSGCKYDEIQEGQIGTLHYRYITYRNRLGFVNSYPTFCKFERDINHLDSENGDI